jgi:hypothetical protein
MQRMCNNAMQVLENQVLMVAKVIKEKLDKETGRLNVY